MRLPFFSGEDPGFQKIIVASIILHLIFIVVAVIPVTPKKRNLKNYYVKLVSPAALPKAVRKRVAKADKKVKVRTKKIPPKKNLKSKADMMLESKTVSSAIDKLHNKKRAIEDEKARKKREAQEKAQRLKDLRARIKQDASKVNEVVPEEVQPEEIPVEEGVIEADGAFETEDLYEGIGEYDARLLYEARLTDYINGFWEVPRIDLEDLVAVFDVRLNKEWKIVSYRIIESSGNRLFDRSVLIAMQNAMRSTEFDPLPEPPLDMHNEVINEGIEYKFHDE